jgi:FMN phosphatase YigB (HAD superfamily)
MHCFIDFDGVLFDRQRFTDQLLDAPTRELYTLFRQQASFTVGAFCAFVQEHGGDGAALRDHLFANAGTAAGYVYPDAANFLSSLKKDGHHVAILSYNPEPDTWQKTKIFSSGLVDLCDAVHITAGKKTDVIAQLQPPTPFFFLDDSAEEITAMKASYPHALCRLHISGTPLMARLPA